MYHLQEGELLAVSPGGVREALFSDENYKLVWNGRLGFAKVAQEAEVVWIHKLYVVFSGVARGTSFSCLSHTNYVSRT